MEVEEEEEHNSLPGDIGISPQNEGGSERQCCHKNSAKMREMSCKIWSTQWTIFGRRGYK